MLAQDGFIFILVSVRDAMLSHIDPFFRSVLNGSSIAHLENDN